MNLPKHLLKYPAGYIYPKKRNGSRIDAYLADLREIGYHDRKSLVFYWHQFDHVFGAIPYSLPALLIGGPQAAILAMFTGGLMKEGMDLANQGDKKDYFKSACDVAGWTCGGCLMALAYVIIRQVI